MRRVALAAVLVALATAASAAPQSQWRITKTEWSEDDEKGFSAFVGAIGESGCNHTVECLRDPANPYRDTDPRGFRFVSDCADLPYMLRAYYAWKNGLPFGYVDGVSGRGGSGDIRYTKGNKPEGRRAIVDNGGLSGPSLMWEVHEGVSSATFRTDAAQTKGILPDFYSPKVQPGSIRPGTAIYDVNGHVAIVYKIEDDGRVHYMDAHPDHTLTRSVYGAQFGQSPARLGGGFKNWRPLRLVGAKARKDGSLVGGRLVYAKNDEIVDFSLEQYTGNVEGTHGDGASAQFEYSGIPLGYFEYVRVAVSGGKMTYNPVAELKGTMRTLCNDLKDRYLAVEAAFTANIHKKKQPSRLPDNIYGTDSMEWEIYSTPSRDARIKTAFVQFGRDLARYIQMWVERDSRIVYDGLFLKEDLQKNYEEISESCRVLYYNSAGVPVILTFDDMMRRLFKMSFDPYHCIERRWGATSEEELASCPDDRTKRRWYEAEQRLRNQIDRRYDQAMSFTVQDLEERAEGSGVDEPPPADIKAVIDAVGARVAFDGMKPVGQ